MGNFTIPTAPPPGATEAERQAFDDLCRSTADKVVETLCIPCSRFGGRQPQIVDGLLREYIAAASPAVQGETGEA